MVRSVRARIGAKALILRGGRVLLLRRSEDAPQYPGYWDIFPGLLLEAFPSLAGTASVRRRCEHRCLADGI